MSLDKSLNEYIQESIQEDADNERFVIEDDQSANWALSKIAEANNELEKINAFSQMQIEKIEKWQEQESKKHNYTIEYFTGLLAEYAFKKREENPDFKSAKLPSGNFGFRKQQPKWEYDDEKVVEALEKAELNDLIRVKKEPNKKDIKKLFNVTDGKVINPETGEVIEGITVVEQQDKFNVKAE